MKGYNDLFLRVDFGSDGPDPIWRAGWRRLTKDFMSKDIVEINSDGYDIFLQENLGMIK